MPRERAESTADITHMGEVQNAIDYIRLPDRQAGIHKVAADLRQEHNQQCSDDEQGDIFLLNWHVISRC